MCVCAHTPSNTPPPAAGYMPLCVYVYEYMHMHTYIQYFMAIIFHTDVIALSGEHDFSHS